MSKPKSAHKVLENKKQHKRRMLALWRTIRYGLDSFVRNSWLSVAATAVMTVTLLIIFSSFLIQNILTDTISTLQAKVDMSIYLVSDTPDDAAKSIADKIQGLSSVRPNGVKYCNSACGREAVIEANSDNKDYIDAIAEATNHIPAVLRVSLKDINKTDQLENFVNTNSDIKKYLNPEYKPSYAGQRRDTIKTIGRAVTFAQTLGIVAVTIFLFISSLVIFNTIRMAIFNRREEIQMMKLIGANQSFIRGPFLVEATIYGFIAAIIAGGVGMWILTSISKTLLSYQVTAQPTIELIEGRAVIVLLALMLVGAVIGIVSSTLATRRYLKQ